MGNNFLSILAVADLSELLLFANMQENFKPISTKSRKFSCAGQNFIAEEIKCLLCEGIIKPSILPLCTHTVVVKDQ